MTNRMFKYQMPMTATEAVVSMPVGAIIRSVGAQGSSICLWAEIPSPDAPSTQRVFHIIATGGEVPEDSTYLGTVFDGPYVWHIVEIKIDTPLPARGGPITAQQGL